MFNSFIDKIKRVNARLRRMENEHFVVNRLTMIRVKDPQYAMIDPRLLPTIRFEDGRLNKEGQLVLANALAEFMRKKAPAELGSRVSFGIYLEKAMVVVQKLGMKEYKRLGLLSGPIGESCFIPEDYWSTAITVVD